MLSALRFIFGVVLALGLSVTTATAATTADQLVALQRAGLDDDILIALIQTDGSVFYLSAEQILDLHRRGLSNRVIRAMQDTARQAQAAVEQAQQVVLAAPVEPQRSNRTEPPPVVNVTQTVTQRVEAPREPYIYTVPVAVPVYVRRAVPPKAQPPVYWGWGGQRRPDSWDDRSARPDNGTRREK
jgi:hypothetical protein